MLTETTVNKLCEMRLSVMANAFKEQMVDSHFRGMSFEDRFNLLVDIEWCARKNNHLKRLAKQASFSDPGACLENIEYHSDRNLDQSQITRLSACAYIAECHNVILLGATGSGKTIVSR
jgi:DNA replication protein DnaC